MKCQLRFRLRMYENLDLVEGLLYLVFQLQEGPLLLIQPLFQACPSPGISPVWVILQTFCIKELYSIAQYVDAALQGHCEKC